MPFADFKNTTTKVKASSKYYNILFLNNLKRTKHAVKVVNNNLRKNM
ncbi:hypothetical protein SAMN05444387_4284 [Flavobacterium pectinovorum]|uniref:Uncharacterized protein n=1 Tax=Flavobacterium pectinovorum TaxID=29533 RepID=A0ABY1J8S8_9FLAO|nr:hypothetical protein SAMN05444387_4284 [Flavobacterium pectinovorum]